VVAGAAIYVRDNIKAIVIKKIGGWGNEGFILVSLDLNGVSVLVASV
jgi:hypothetical protein